MGTSSRRHGIIEIAAVKTGLNGESLDTFWSYANPGHSIPEKITERTGITDEALADAPFSNEVLKRWFEWVGPHALLFCQHAHFNAKFVCAGLYKQDIEPPSLRILDVVHWAKELEIPVDQDRLRPLLEYIGITLPPHSRTLDACKAIVPLVAHLLRKQAGVHLEADTTGVLSRFVGKKTEVVNEEKAYASLETLSETLENACGEELFDRESYHARMARREETPVLSAAANGTRPTSPRMGTSALSGAATTGGMTRGVSGLSAALSGSNPACPMGGRASAASGKTTGRILKSQT